MPAATPTPKPSGTAPPRPAPKKAAPAAEVSPYPKLVFEPVMDRSRTLKSLYAGTLLDNNVIGEIFYVPRLSSIAADAMAYKVASDALGLPVTKNVIEALKKANLYATGTASQEELAAAESTLSAAVMRRIQVLQESIKKAEEQGNKIFADSLRDALEKTLILQGATNPKAVTASGIVVEPLVIAGRMAAANPDAEYRHSFANKLVEMGSVGTLVIPRHRMPDDPEVLREVKNLAVDYIAQRSQGPSTVYIGSIRDAALKFADSIAKNTSVPQEVRDIARRILEEPGPKPWLVERAADYAIAKLPLPPRLTRRKAKGETATGTEAEAVKPEETTAPAQAAPVTAPAAAAEETPPKVEDTATAAKPAAAPAAPAEERVAPLIGEETAPRAAPAGQVEEPVAPLIPEDRIAGAQTGAEAPSAGTAQVRTLPGSTVVRFKVGDKVYRTTLADLAKMGLLYQRERTRAAGATPLAGGVEGQAAEALIEAATGKAMPPQGAQQPPTPPPGQAPPAGATPPSETPRPKPEGPPAETAETQPARPGWLWPAATHIGSGMAGAGLMLLMQALLSKKEEEDKKRLIASPEIPHTLRPPQWATQQGQLPEPVYQTPEMQVQPYLYSQPWQPPAQMAWPASPWMVWPTPQMWQQLLYGAFGNQR